MTLAFDAPLLLASLLPVLAAAAWGLALTRRRSRSFRRVTVVLPALAAVLLGFALARPQVIRAPQASHIVVLLDHSASARTAPWQNAAFVQDLLRQRLHPDTRVTVLAVGETLRPLQTRARVGDSAPWDPFPPPSGEGLNLQAALAWRADHADRDPRWLITDGLLDLAPVRQAHDVPLAITRIPPAATDVGIADLQQRMLPQGREIAARIQSTGRGTVAAQFFRDGALFAEAPVAFESPGVRTITVLDPSAKEIHTRYTLRLRSNDPWPENDSADLVATPPDQPTALLLSGNLADWQERLPTTRIVPHALFSSADTLADLAPYGLIILNNTAAQGLPPGSDKLLDTYVRDFAGGLLIVGDSAILGPGQYPGTALEDLSPLASSPPDGPPAQVLFVLDASGSMAQDVAAAAPTRRFAFAAAGVRMALTTLRPTDTVGVIAYASDARMLAHGPLKAVEPVLGQALDAVRPTGPTHPDSALTLLETHVGPNTFIILLTDGEIPRMDVPRWRALVADRGGKLAIVAPSPLGRDMEAVRQGTQATLRHAAEPREWPALLQRLAVEGRMGRAMTSPLAWRRSGESAPAGTTRGWVEAWPKSAATVSAQGADGRALAAHWQRGLGRVATVAFADGSEAYGALLNELASQVAAGAGDRRFVLQAQRGEGPGGTWRIVAEARDTAPATAPANAPRVTFLNEAALTVRVATDGGTLERAMEQTAPGRYEAVLPAGVGPFSAVVVSAEGRLVGRVSPAEVPSAEWPANAGVASVPEGVRELPLTDAPERWRPVLLATRLGLWPWLVGAAAAVLLGSLWGRRLPAGGVFRRRLLS